MPLIDTPVMTPTNPGKDTDTKGLFISELYRNISTIDKVKLCTYKYTLCELGPQ